MFVESASFILRATVDGKSKTKVKKTEPLWDPKKLKKDDWFSCISYLQVKTIEGSKIRVENHLGGEWFISKDLLLSDCFSADHYEKEIKCTMTELSGLLESFGDTVFKVCFHKKLDQK